MRILVADDSSDIIRMLSFFLQANGFTVVTASDCMQAQRFAKQGVDAVLLDVHLPGGNGVDTLRLLKRAPQTKLTPVIMISADPDPTLPQLSINLGAADFLAKPLDLDKLLASLKSSLQLTDVGKASVAASPAPKPLAQPAIARRILVAEDDALHRRVLESFLPRWGYEVEFVVDGKAALEALQAKDAPRLALLDWMMPGLDGASICRKLREQSGNPYTYIVLLSAKGAKSDLLEAMDAGADDYLVKPFDSQELYARLRSGHRILQLQEELLKAQEELRHQASHDALTKVANRRAILNKLRDDFDGGVATILLDVDHFKRVNDTFGHQAGDTVLQEVARRLKAGIRACDHVGRYGGEEFLIVVRDCNESGAVDLAERLRKAVCGSPITLPDGAQMEVTASLGIATSQAIAATTEEQLIAAADQALYEAKRNGRNRIAVGRRIASPVEGALVGAV